MDSKSIYTLLLPHCKPGYEKTLWLYVDWCISNHAPCRSNGVDRHHILPKSLFPEFKNFTKSPWNKSVLRYKDHFKAHKLLARCIPKMSSAFWIMSHKRYERAYKMNAREYAMAKRMHSDARRASLVNTKWFHDPYTHNALQLVPGDQPTGWLPGPAPNPNHTTTNGYKKIINVLTLEERIADPKNIKYPWLIKQYFTYHDPATMEYAKFIEGMQPESWVRGHTNNKLTHVYHDPVTKENRRFIGTAPTGWVAGYALGTGAQPGYKIYHNPATSETIGIREGQPVPDGFVQGQSPIHNTTKNSVWYYNPATSERRLFKTDAIIPNGWLKGTNSIGTSGTKWWHNPSNPKERRLIKGNEAVPKNWVPGIGAR